MAFRVGRVFEIESGHILSKHPDKCRFPHGHSRKVEVVLVVDHLDANDMVCDFKAIKRELGELLDSWDHALCLNTDDPNFAFYHRTYGAHIIPFEHVDPTTEILARAIFDGLKGKLATAHRARGPYCIPAGVRVERVRLTETSSSWAEYSE